MEGSLDYQDLSDDYVEGYWSTAAIGLQGIVKPPLLSMQDKAGLTSSSDKLMFLNHISPGSIDLNVFNTEFTFGRYTPQNEVLPIDPLHEGGGLNSRFWRNGSGPVCSFVAGVMLEDGD